MSDETLTSTLGSRVRSGAAWSALDVAVGRLGQFAMGVIVARILVPKDFGVFAVALVVHAIIINVSELGVSAALIRDDDEEIHRAAPTVVTIAVVSSFVLGGLMALSAGTLAGLLGAPSASGAIVVMAITLPLAGMTAVPAALLRRGFRMRRIFVADTANTVVTALVVLPLALAGWGPMALAWSWVAGQSATTLLFLTYAPGRYWPGWNRLEARRLLAFGLPLAGANILNFSILNVDYIIIGRVLGAAVLGLYVLAFNISNWPMNVIGSVVRSVSLPGFAELRRDGEAMPEHFATALRTVAGISLPICLIMGALARPVVLTVYGSQWGLAADALVGLAVLGAARIIIELMADFLVSLGRTRAVFLAQLPWLVGLAVALLVVVPEHGIRGAGLVQAGVAVCLMLPIYLVFLRRAGVSVSMVMRALLPPLVWSMVAAGVAVVVARQIPQPFLACVAGGTAGLVVYLIPNAATIRRVIASMREARGAGDETGDDSSDGPSDGPGGRPGDGDGGVARAIVVSDDDAAFPTVLEPRAPVGVGDESS